jgi:hypothetical protein
LMYPSDEHPRCRLPIGVFSSPSRCPFQEKATVDSVKLTELSLRVPGEPCLGNHWNTVITEVTSKNPRHRRSSPAHFGQSSGLLVSVAELFDPDSAARI